MIFIPTAILCVNTFPLTDKQLKKRKRCADGKEITSKKTKKAVGTYIHVHRIVCGRYMYVYLRVVTALTLLSIHIQANSRLRKGRRKNKAEKKNGGSNYMYWFVMFCLCAVTRIAK